MIYDFKSRKNRILCIPETSDETRHIRNMCINVSRQKNTERDTYSIEDCLVNRISLGLNLNMPQAINKYRLGANAAAISSENRLKPFQQEDLNFSLQLRAVLNANPMGYGKTVEGLSYARALDTRRLLILCPKSVCKQWLNMCQVWFPELYSEAKILIAPRNLGYGTKFPIIVITNYEQLLNAKVHESLRSIQWDCIIADEVHRLRNPKAKSTIAAKSLPCYNKIGLSGTPILNHPDNLWSICHFLNPWYFGSSYWGFVNMFCEVEETFWGKKIKGLTRDPDKQWLLRETLSKFTIRNPAGAVGVGVAENDVTLEMYPKQKKLYNDIKQLAVEALSANNVSIANGMSQLIHLQQVTSNPGLFDIDKNIKFEWIKDLLDDNSDLKILVFSRFRQTILALNEYLNSYGIATIHGGIKNEERESEKIKFISNENIRIMSGTIGALGESVDGLQYVCHTVIFIDKMWNPEENNQAIGRVLRNSQEMFVNVYTLVCEKTVDEKVGRVNLKKIEDIRSVLV